LSYRKAKNEVIRENQLDFLERLYDMGVDIGIDKIKLLFDSGRIKLSEEKQEEIDNNEKSLHQAIDEHKEEVLQEKEDELKKSFDDFSLTDRFNINIKGDINSSMWMPKSRIHHTDEFVLWIDSINRGFQDMIKYDPFRIYCEQAKRWLEDETSIKDFDTVEQQREYAMNEFERCTQNTLYAMDKYLMLREGDMSSGSMKYLSKPVHKVICFLTDCGYSYMLGKPRQIAATSTLAGIAMFKIMFKKNYFIKMIAQDKDKVVEIFEDKIKYPFGELVSWMKPEVSNDRDNLFRLGKKTNKKGTRGGIGSKIQVVAPSVAAINGGSPPLVMVDEAGYIGILGKMIKEARPTMFMQDPITKKLEMKRQIIVWGTGGEMDKGGKAYEVEFANAVTKWKQREFTSGIIPIFCDWTTRPGITKEHYNNEKKAYHVEGPEKEARMVQFRQHYPSNIEDMFLTSHKLLVGIDWINEQLDRLRSVDPMYKPKIGYFEPIYDTSKPANENSDLPYEIIGSQFIPLDDTKDDMRKASTIMFAEPNRAWVDRYYQGTDPIATDNGYSNMASVVFDNYWKTPACIVDYRDPDHKFTFLQCMLAGIYYNTSRREKSIPELVESNIGTSYTDYKETKGYDGSLVYRTQLPSMMQGGGNMIGIDNRGNRNRFIINKMFEVVTNYGENFYIDRVFTQLKTFQCTINSNGTETWGTADPKNYHDDVLFALVFAYICTLCFEHKEPREIKTEADMYTTKHKLVRRPDGTLTRQVTRVKNKI
jgi:hypothetical protein